jgi:hypothetical protein
LGITIAFGTTSFTNEVIGGLGSTTCLGTTCSTICSMGCLGIITGSFSMILLITPLLLGVGICTGYDTY